MMSNRKQDGYLSYLLRLWRATEEQGIVWRASLQDPLTGERVGFASLEKLLDFLRQQTASPAAGTQPAGKPGSEEKETC